MASATAPPPGGSAITGQARHVCGYRGAIPIVRIEPPRGWLNLRLAELWEYRELLYFFVWRDIKVRYKQTVIGVAWVILQPLMTMGVFTIFSGGWRSFHRMDCLIRCFILRRWCLGLILRRR